VLVSTVVTPIAEVRWTSMGGSDDQLYFVWGRYSLLNHRIWTYGSGPNPYPVLAIQNLVVFWITCGIVLSAIILYSSRTSHRPLVVWAVVAAVLIAQNELPLTLIGGVIFIAYSITYTLILPIPSILAIVALVALRLMRRPNPIREATSPLSA